MLYKHRVVAAASYEARKYGIHSAMPSKSAIAKCPNLIFAQPRFEIYRAISAQKITRSRTFEKCINSLDTIITEAVSLLEIVELEGKSIRLLGISLSNLDNEKKLQIVQL